LSDLLLAMRVMATWAVPLAALLGTMLLARRIYHRRDRRNPLTKDLLRGPGHSLRMKRDDLFHDVMSYLAVGPVMPLLMLAVYQAQQLNGRVAPAWLYVVAGIGVLGYCAYKIAGTIRQLRRVGLGLEAETAVGQGLNWLMRDGFVVFHDVPGEGLFNVDHVVVGAPGVFAVETKGRSKPLGKDGHVVKQDGDVLRFPGWSETEPLAQATRNAAWLSRWLGSAVGQKVDVTPILCLPGWMVERTSKPSMIVINGKNCGGFFKKSRGAGLSEQLIAQIVHQLDARCRDVEPRAYKPMKD